MNHPSLYNLVFSDKKSIRWKRHILFWLAIYVYHMLRIGLMMPEINTWPALWKILDYSFFRGVVSNVFFTYTVVYYLIPVFFNRGKYILFVLGLLCSLVLMMIYGQLNDVLHSGSTIAAAIHGDENFYFSWNVWKPGAIRLLGNPPLICGLFIALKHLKKWRQEQIKTELLARENANAELQLLKAQVHPHFLFNTLNNIYSFSLYQSPQAGTLVKKLSGMLDYMIHECEENMVPLEREIKLLKDYIGLENVRYGKRLTMEVAIHGNFENKLITPLLMIPFIENSFKHGCSQMLQQPWIKLEITTENNRLFFKLSNSKPSVMNGNTLNNGIGLNNVKKRLQLLYPNKHQLDIYSTHDTFIVNMQLLLEERALAENRIASSDKAVSYA